MSNSNTREELEKPNLKNKQEMYKLYQYIFNSNFLDKKKIGLLNVGFGVEPWGWRVVGITKNAVDLIKKNNGNQNVTKHLVRDHFFQGRKWGSNPSPIHPSGRVISKTGLFMRQLCRHTKIGFLTGSCRNLHKPPLRSFLCPYTKFLWDTTSRTGCRSVTKPSI